MLIQVGLDYSGDLIISIQISVERYAEQSWNFGILSNHRVSEGFSSVGIQGASEEIKGTVREGSSRFRGLWAIFRGLAEVFEKFVGASGRFYMRFKAFQVWEFIGLTGYFGGFRSNLGIFQIDWRKFHRAWGIFKVSRRFGRSFNLEVFSSHIKAFQLVLMRFLKV